MRSLLVTRLAEAVDRGSFVAARGRLPGWRPRSQRADLVFVVDLLGGAGRLLVLIEHKSAPDPALFGQVLRHCGHLLNTMQVPAVAEALAPLPPGSAPVVDDLDTHTEPELLVAPLRPSIEFVQSRANCTAVP